MWQLYKDQSLNQTLFWNTTFSSGSGTTTQFATAGLLTVLGWLVFLGLFIKVGASLLLSRSNLDTTWLFITSVSFVAAFYLWVMFFIYNPGPTLLLLAAVFTGIVIAVRSVQAGKAGSVVLLRFGASTTAGFLLTGVVMLMIIGSSLLLYSTARLYTAALLFAQTLQPDAGYSIEMIEERLQDATASREVTRSYELCPLPVGELMRF